MRIRIPLLAIAFVLLGIVGSAAARPAVEASSSLSPYDIWLADRAPRHAPPAAEADPLAARRPVSERPRAVIRDRPFVPFDAPSVESVGVEQVIVTTDALAAAFQAVADRDTYRGIPTVVRTLSWIDQHYAGLDVASRVRAFLRDAYDRWGTRYALLGADSDAIPPRYVPWNGDQLATDLYYECLDGEWNEDGDATFGEPLPSTAIEGLVNDVAVGPDGKVWIATYVGVAYLESGQFTLFDTSAGLPTNGVLSVDVAADGTVWVGTTNGVARWNGGSSWTAFQQSDGLPGFEAPAVAVRSQNDVWVGTNGGLAHWNGSAWETWTTLDGLPSPLVTAIEFAGSDVWCGTAAGAVRLSGGTLTVFNTANSGLLSNWVIAVTVDDLGRIWFGHSNNYFAQGGISRFDGSTWFADSLPALPGVSIRSLRVEPDGVEYWAATELGLLHHTASGDELLDDQDGLAGSDTYAVDRGASSVFVACSVGLSLGTPGNWTTYTKDNGLPVADFDYDEIDLYPELAVGRVPARTVQQVATYLQKLDDYESGVNAATANSALFLGEILFSGSDGKNICLQAKSYLPPSFSTTELYEVDGNENRLLALQALEQGPGIVVHVGHGSYDLMAVGSGLELLFNTDLRLSDSGGRPALVIGYSCNAGGFDQESSMEQMLFNPNGGAVVTLSNTRESVASLDSALNAPLLGLLFASTDGRPSLALQQRRRDLLALGVDEYRIASWSRRMYLIRSYLGSPTISIWRDTPKSLAVAHAPTLPAVRSPFAVVVTDGTSGLPVANALVCVSKGVEDYAYGSTDASGAVTFDFRPESVGDVTVRVSAADYLPVETTAAVLPIAQPNPVAAGWERIDGSLLGESGEWQLRFAVRNAGTASALGWTVHLQCDDPRVNVVQGSTTIPALTAGATAWTSALSVAVDATVADGDAIPFRLVGSGPVAFVESYDVSASTPTLVFLDMVASGNDLFPRVVNRGSQSTGSITGTLVADNGSATVLDGLAAAPALGPGQTTVFPDGFQATGGVGARFVLTIDDGLGHVHVQTFDRDAPEGATGIASFPRGQGALVTWAPSPAADLAGYRVLRKNAGGGYTEVFGDLVRRASRIELPVPDATGRPFAVVAVDASGNASADTVDVMSYALPPMLAGWPQRLTSIVGPSPVVAVDLDGDSRQEIVFGAMWESDAVHVFHDDGTEWFDGDADPVTNGIFAKTGERVHAAPLAVDLDGDGFLEIFAASFDFSVHGWSTAGGAPTVMPGWPIAASSAYRSSPVAGDFDGDGELEIVTIALQGLVRVLEADGTLVPGWPRTANRNGLASTPGVADLNDDGKDDVVFAANDSLLYAISGDGTDLPGWPVFVGAAMQSSPVLVDVDGDGDWEIFAIDKNGRCWGFQHDDNDAVPGPDPLDGWPISFTPITSFPQSPAVADLDGDGSPEFIINGAGEIVIVHSDGTPFAGWPLETGVDGKTSPIVADVNADGSLDVIVGSSDLRVTAYDKNGAVIPGWPLELIAEAQSTPYVSDIDDDGDLDLVIGSDDFLVRVFDLPTLALPGAAPWPGFHGGADLRGVYTHVAYDPTFVGPVVGGGPVTPTLQLLPSAPNPFRGRTELRFVVPVPGPVTLEIFDVTGRKVASPIMQQIYEPGSHAVSWDGRDGSGRAVSSGVFFLRITAGSSTRTGKVLRIR